MPTVPRQLKAAGAASYQQEVARGVPDIIDAELDGDIQPLYDLVNGTLDDANINANLQGVKINYLKLALQGKIQQSDLAGPFDASTLLAPGSVHLAQLALAASVAGFAITVGASNVPISGETVLAEVTWTSRGSAYFVLGTVNGYAFTNAQGQGTLATYLHLDPPTPGVAGGTILQQTSQQVGIIGFPTGGSQQVIVPVSTTLFNINIATLGAHRLQLTAKVTAGAEGLSLVVDHPTAFIWEPA
jgi:hypothetical protein